MPSVTCNGIQLAYEEQGSGEPLICIMGLGAPGSLWEDHVAEYQKQFRCILIDNRGAGESDKPAGPYSSQMMAQDTAALMDALGIRNARVAGLSMGSAIAQELALARPDLVRCLALISSWSRCDRYTVAVFEHFKKMRALASPADFMQLLQLWIAAPGHYEAHYDELVQGQQEAAEGYMPLHAFQAQCDACSGHDAYDRLDQIAAPALLTVGDADIFTPLRLSAEMHDRMPNSELWVLPGRGHIHHWEDLDPFNARTTAFLLEH